MVIVECKKNKWFTVRDTLGDTLNALSTRRVLVVYYPFDKSLDSDSPTCRPFLVSILHLQDPPKRDTGRVRELVRSYEGAKDVSRFHCGDGRSGRGVTIYGAPRPEDKRGTPGRGSPGWGSGREVPGGELRSGGVQDKGSGMIREEGWGGEVSHEELDGVEGPRDEPASVGRSGRRAPERGSRLEGPGGGLRGGSPG